MNDAKNLAQECAEDLEAFKKWTINDGALSETETSAKKAEAKPEVVVDRKNKLKVCCTVFSYFCGVSAILFGFFLRFLLSYFLRLVNLL